MNEKQKAGAVWMVPAFLKSIQWVDIGTVI